MGPGQRAGGGGGSRDPGLVAYDGCLRLRGAPLWLDARRPVPLSFVSSAAVARRHQRVVASSRTADLLGGSLRSSEALVSPFGRPFSLGELGLELVPAGSVVGAAQLLLRFRGVRLLYCGGVRPGPSAVAEPYERREADVLVLDCPYDSPPFLFPGRGRVVDEIVRWARSVLQGGEVPILLAGALGTAQELCRALGDAGLPVRAHRKVAWWNRRVRAAGADPGSAPELRSPVDEGVAVVAPVRASGGEALRRLVPRGRRALVSGRAVLDEAVRAAGAEVGFALSSHADSRALRKLVRNSGASHVYLGPRHGERFEGSLRRAGLGVTRFAGGAGSAQLDLFGPLPAAAEADLARFWTPSPRLR